MALAAPSSATRASPSPSHLARPGIPDTAFVYRSEPAQPGLTGGGASAPPSAGGAHMHASASAAPPMGPVMTTPRTSRSRSSQPGSPATRSRSVGSSLRHTDSYREVFNNWGKHTDWYACER